MPVLPQALCVVPIVASVRMDQVTDGSFVTCPHEDQACSGAPGRANSAGAYTSTGTGTRPGCTVAEPGNPSLCGLHSWGMLVHTA